MCLRQGGQGGKVAAVVLDMAGAVVLATLEVPRAGHPRALVFLVRLRELLGQLHVLDPGGFLVARAARAAYPVVQVHGVVILEVLPTGEVRSTGVIGQVRGGHLLADDQGTDLAARCALQHVVPDVVHRSLVVLASWQVQQTVAHDGQGGEQLVQLGPDGPVVQLGHGLLLTLGQGGFDLLDWHAVAGQLGENLAVKGQPHERATRGEQRQHQAVDQMVHSLCTDGLEVVGQAVAVTVVVARRADAREGEPGVLLSTGEVRRPQPVQPGELALGGFAHDGPQMRIVTPPRLRLAWVPVTISGFSLGVVRAASASARACCCA